MTVFLTFGVYSLRVSNDLPVQSKYFPMISVYFLVGVLYAFMSIIWFAVANSFLTKNSVPKCLRQIVYLIKRYQSAKTVKQSESKESVKDEEVDQQIRKCNKCEDCKICLTAKEKEAIKKKQKEETELLVSILNFIFFILMSILMIATNLWIWIVISTN